MLGRDKSRPEFTEQDALKIARDFYGLKGSVEELPSYCERNFCLRTDSGDKYVLKFAAASEKREILEFQNLAMEHLSTMGDEMMTPRVIETPSGEQISVVEDAKGVSHFVRLLSFIPGKVLAEVSPHSADLLCELGVFIGSLSRGLENFSHPATQRELYWDLKNASSTIHQYKEYIATPEQVALVEYFLKEFETRVLPKISQLRTSVIHNDSNDYNILVRWEGPSEKLRFSIIDFEDMVYSHTIFELAVALAYAILRKADPIAAATQVIRGYHSIFPLTELELDLLYPLICARLAMSVSSSAYRKKLEPDNEYLIISESAAWNTLHQLKQVHPRFATYSFTISINDIVYVVEGDEDD